MNIRSSRRAILGALILLSAIAGCALFDPGALRVTAAIEEPDSTTQSTSLSDSDTLVWITVTVENVGRTRTEWGRGSSTCQLALVVRVDGEDVPAAWPPSRVCTADLGTHSLGPGQSRSETIGWDGGIQRGPGDVQRLEGTYEVRGAAGREALSPPVLVTVEGQP